MCSRGCDIGHDDSAGFVERRLEDREKAMVEAHGDVRAEIDGKW